MVLMALDHTRGFFHFGAIRGYGPLDLATTTAPLFLTRWITHYCAPTFIFLAGTGAFLSSTRGKSKHELSWFLVTRGLWLVLLELTYIKWAGWAFAIDLHSSNGAVIWAIGWSMVALAAIIHLPLTGIAVFGVGMIVSHNLLDGVTPESWGAASGLWKILHAGGPVEFAPGYFLYAGYPLIPWIGVMAAGYAFGAILQRDRAERQGFILRLGVALTLGFVALRFSNFYGNTTPWTSQSTPLRTVFSFLDCRKYPPSLCYLLMTLGPALCVLAWLDRAPRPGLRSVQVFGRVPMFYYLLHLPLIHGMALTVELIRNGHAEWLHGGKVTIPPAAGSSLSGVYLAWAVALLLLYPVCTWFADLKRRRRDPWLSYL